MQKNEGQKTKLVIFLHGQLFLRMSLTRDPIIKKRLGSGGSWNWKTERKRKKSNSNNKKKTLVNEKKNDAKKTKKWNYE